MVLFAAFWGTNATLDKIPDEKVEVTSGLSSGEIAGIIIGVLLALLLIGLVVVAIFVQRGHMQNPIPPQYVPSVFAHATFVNEPA